VTLNVGTHVYLVDGYPIKVRSISNLLYRVALGSTIDYGLETEAAMIIRF